MKVISVRILTEAAGEQAVLNAVRGVLLDVKPELQAVTLSARVEDAELADILAAKRASTGLHVAEDAVVRILRRSPDSGSAMVRENGYVSTPGGLRHWSEVYPQYAAAVDTWSTK